MARAELSAAAQARSFVIVTNWDRELAALMKPPEQ
jgi:hypothetical protein